MWLAQILFPARKYARESYGYKQGIDHNQDCLVRQKNGEKIPVTSSPVAIWAAYFFPAIQQGKDDWIYRLF